MTENRHAAALSDEELMSVAYGDDILSPDQRDHLAQCSACQQQLSAYTYTNARLLSKLYRSMCPDGVKLSYYALGTLAEEERARIASHALDCPACADELADLRRAQASVDLYPAAGWSPLTSIRRIFANLVAQQAKPVTRDMTPGTGWPRQYRAETIDLSLHLTRASTGEMLLLGIITSTDPDEPVNAFENALVELYDAPGPLTSEETTKLMVRATTEVDDVGNIVLEDISTGHYVMILRLPEREVVIEGLNIEPTS